MTNPEVITVNTLPHHVREMAEVMHEQTAETARKLGVEPKKLLSNYYIVRQQHFHHLSNK
jgi:hypothetical protein